MAGCPCGLIPRERCPLCRIPRKCVTSLPSLLRGQRRVAADMFRERALLHYQACCADSGVSPLPYSANGRYCILQHYSADSRDVILSRRACGASKNLLGPPKSGCNAIMPAFLYRASCHFDRSEKQSDEQSGEISHIVRLFLQCTSARVLYHHPIVTPQDPSIALPAVAPLRMTSCVLAQSGVCRAACRR